MHEFTKSSNIPIAFVINCKTQWAMKKSDQAPDFHLSILKTFPVEQSSIIRCSILKMVLFAFQHSLSNLRASYPVLAQLDTSPQNHLQTFLQSIRDLLMLSIENEADMKDMNTTLKSLINVQAVISRVANFPKK